MIVSSVAGAGVLPGSVRAGERSAEARSVETNAADRGDFNVAIGDGAMKFNVTGNNNVALGMDAGALTTGSDNILIDHKGVDGESGKIRIGTS